jgi:hypothetical protein
MPVADGPVDLGHLGPPRDRHGDRRQRADEHAGGVDEDDGDATGHGRAH